MESSKAAGWESKESAAVTPSTPADMTLYHRKREIFIHTTHYFISPEFVLKLPQEFI